MAHADAARLAAALQAAEHRLHAVRAADRRRTAELARCQQALAAAAAGQVLPLKDPTLTAALEHILCNMSLCKLNITQAAYASTTDAKTLGAGILMKHWW